MGQNGMWNLRSQTSTLLDLLQVSLAGKTGEGIKARETCNTWQRGSLAGQNPVQSASFYKKTNIQSYA